LAVRTEEQDAFFALKTVQNGGFPDEWVPVTCLFSMAAKKENG
jgi:hypothetical protein